MEPVVEAMRRLLKAGARLLTGADRREFQAKTTLEMFEGNARRAERVMGWSREAVLLGLNEVRTGIRCVDNVRARGRKKTEALLAGLEADIREVVDPVAHADPQMKTTLAYTRITAARVRAALIEQKGYRDDELPSRRTISSVLNRLGYRLRRVEKSRPKKKSPKQRRSSPMSPSGTSRPQPTRPSCASVSTRKPMLRLGTSRAMGEGEARNPWLRSITT